MLILKEDQVHEDLKEVCHHDGGDCDDKPKLLRYKISLNFFQIFQSICWTVVQLLMLLVFVKYGKPVEQDAMIILRNKLEDVFRQEQAAALDPKARSEKR